MDDFEISVSFKDDIAHIRLSGEVQNKNASEFSDMLRQAISVTKWILIDMSGVQYLCSAAMGALMSSLTHVSKLGGAMIAFGVTEHVRRVFDTIKFSQIREITHSPYATLEEAEAAIKSVRSGETGETPRHS